MKAHIFRELVNDLRDIATQWHGSQQLRERISRRLHQDVSINEDPANDGWIPWAGGECPLPSGAEHFVRLRCGNEYGPNDDPEGWRWDHRDNAGDNEGDDIIAYRIVRK